jgi:hypothetical protein
VLIEPAHDRYPDGRLARRSPPVRWVSSRRIDIAVMIRSRGGSLSRHDGLSTGVLALRVEHGTRVRGNSVSHETAGAQRFRSSDMGVEPRCLLTITTLSPLEALVRRARRERRRRHDAALR